jgi:preprotein translocase subunit YajC
LQQSGFIEFLFQTPAAYAAEAGGAAGAQGGLMQLLPMILIFGVVFYFLIYRPQKKRQQQHDQLLGSIVRGDTVVTAGGFFGKVSDILDDSYIIELAEGVKVRILKSSISTRRDQGDAKSKQHRPKKRRKIGDRTAEEQRSEVKSSSEEGVTHDENSILMGGSEALENGQDSAGVSADESVADESEKEKDKEPKNSDNDNTE